MPMYGVVQYVQVVVRTSKLDIGPTPTKDNTEGYPFRCFRSYTNSSNLTVYPLDKGSIVEYDDYRGKAKVSIPKRDKRIWVNITHLHVGRVRKYGNVAIETGLQPTLSATISTSELNSTDYPLTSLLFPLTCSIMNQQGSLPWLASFIPRLLHNRQAALNLCRRIADGANRAGLSDAFRADSRWTWQDFVDNGIRIDDRTPGTGIYIRFYSQFKVGEELHGSKPRAYGGKTSRSFGMRHHEHNDATNNPNDSGYNGGHYVIARQAGKTDSIIMVYLDNFSEREIAVAEQAIILILRLYRPEVIGWVQRVSEGQPAQSATDSGSAALAETACWLEAKEPATQLTQLAEDLWAKIGWGQSLGTSGGCNKDSPLNASDSYEKTLWTMVDFPDRRIYYRTPLPSAATGNQVKFFSKQIYTPAGKKSAFTIQRGPAHPHPPHGGLMYFSVEIMKSGRHPQAYSRLPDLGIWSNWQDANQVALKVRWRDGDQWYQLYLENIDVNLRLQNPTEPGGLAVYVAMINFRTFLERTRFNPPLAWMERWGTARVKQLKFDHLAQAISIVDPPPPIQAPLPTPTWNEQQLSAAYSALGLQQYGKVKEDTSIYVGYGRPGEGVCCDLCFTVRNRHRIFPRIYRGTSFAPCITDSKSASCLFCRDWGHRCTFSPHDVAARNARSLGWYPPRLNISRSGSAGTPSEAQKIDDPGFEKYALLD